MQIKNKKLIENSIFTFFTQIISYVIPLISLPYLSRILGAEKFGLVFWAQACIMYFMIITDFGFVFSAVQRIAENRNNQDKINEIFASVMCVKGLLIIICFIIFNLIVTFIPQFHQEFLLFNLTFLLVVGNALYPIWYFQGIEQMKYVTYLNLITKSVFLFLLFIFVKSSDDYIIVAMLNSLGYLFSGLIGIYVAINRFGLKVIIPKWGNVVNEFKYSSEFFWARASETLYTNTNSFILGIITSPTVVGYYVAAEKIFSAVNGLQIPITTPLYPYMTRNKDIKLYKKILFVFLICLIFLCLGIYILAPKIIVVFYGVELYDAYKILRIFCITLFFASTCGMLGYPLLAAFGHSKTVNLSASVAAIFHVFFMLLLLGLGKLNVNTIAYLTAMPEIIMIILRIFAIKKYKIWKLS